MPTISPEFIERYQLEYQKNPNSRIFAPLAEAYRQMGLLDEALRVAAKGVQAHPDFAGGRVAYGKILVDRDEKEKAMAQFEKAIELSPDNLLAHSLLGETLIDLRRPKEALKAFKMVLFLNPKDEKALRTVKKWEFLSADDYEGELFEMRPVFGGDILRAPGSEASNREADRALSLADAFTVRGDFERAQNVLEDARDHLGPVPEIEKRLGLLAKRNRANAPPPEAAQAAPIQEELAAPIEPSEPSSERSPEPSEEQSQRTQQIEKLQLFLHRITVRRTDD